MNILIIIIGLIIGFVLTFSLSPIKVYPTLLNQSKNIYVDSENQCYRYLAVKQMYKKNRTLD